MRFEKPEKIAARLWQNPPANEESIVKAIRADRDAIADALIATAQEAWDGPRQEGMPSWLEAFVSQLRGAR